FCLCFFSSRRRHTRFSRDWSSDVCSSDLGKRPYTQNVTILTHYGRRLPNMFYSTAVHRYPVACLEGPAILIHVHHDDIHSEVCKIGRASCRERVKISAATVSRQL